ncbi:tyrosine phosphatase family protein [Brevundimonas sp. NPDC090276]|uniref:tyrosine phosphatase family protein n=1 Tax=Brevundimonas sp. NPDC090276 TaxID=3363956 RepID=UPI00383A9380
MKLIVAPLHEVAALVARHQPSHLISLASPGYVDAPLADAPPYQLDLRFNDIAEPREGLTPPTEADVAALLTFAASWDGARPLLIHCWAGVSRSTAAAYVIACARSAPGREAEWARRLRSLAPTATPNPLIVALADRHLNRDAAMVRAIAAIGRGTETAWGAPFELDLSPQGASR